MDHSAAIAFAFIIPTRNHEARSALPDAPVVDDGRARVPRATGLRAQLATLLHRLAWAVEPEPWAIAPRTTAAARRAPSSSASARS